MLFVEVLGGEHDRADTDGFAVAVGHGNLALGVWSERWLGSVFADLGEAAQYRVGKLDWGGHKRVCFRAGIAEHDALVASAFVLVGRGIYALGDVGGLLMQKIGDFTGVPVELVLLIADVFDAGARDRINLAHILGELGLIGEADFAADDDTVCCGKSFAGDAGFGLLCEEGVEDGIRDAVADFIRVTFGDGL